MIISMSKRKDKIGLNITKLLLNPLLSFLFFDFFNKIYLLSLFILEKDVL